MTCVPEKGLVGARGLVSELGEERQVVSFPDSTHHCVKSESGQ